MFRIYHPQPKRRTGHPKNRGTPKTATHNHLMPNHREPSPNRNPLPCWLLLKRPNHRMPKHIISKLLSPPTNPLGHVLHRSLYNPHNLTSPSRFRTNPPSSPNQRKQPSSILPNYPPSTRKHHSWTHPHLIHPPNKNSAHNHTPVH